MAQRGMTPERAERANKVMLMRLDGIPFREIATTVGVSLSTCHEDYKAAVRETYRSSTEELISTQHQRVEALYQTFAPLAKTGDVDSANVCIKLNDQINKLFGLNGAVKLESTSNAGEDFAALLQALRDVPTPSHDADHVRDEDDDE